MRGQDAYSWVEVFFPEYGWVDFDPTPPVVSEGFGGIAGERIAAQRLRPFASDIFANERTQDLSDPFADFEELQNLAGDLRLDLDGGGTGFTVWWVLAPPDRGGGPGGRERHGPDGVETLAARADARGATVDVHRSGYRAGAACAQTPRTRRRNTGRCSVRRCGTRRRRERSLPPTRVRASGRER